MAPQQDTDPVAGSGDLTGQRALVTGGTRGIGAGVAEHLSRAGADVVVAARTEPEGSFAGRFVAADLSTAQGVQELAAAALDLLGGVDVLVDNAGGHTPGAGGVLATSEETWLEEVSLNLLSAVRLDRQLVPGMVERRHGVVVHISSGAARLAQTTGPAYSAAKAGLNAYSKALATEVAGHGVRVNAILPGFIETSALDGFLAAAVRESGEDPAVVRARTLAQFVERLGVPAGHAGHPHDVGAMVAFLASPAAAYITGTQLVVDGGLMPTV